MAEDSGVWQHSIEISGRLKSDNFDADLYPRRKSLENGAKKEKTYFGLSKRQILTISIFGFSNVLSTAIISIQAPFYPKIAEDKGASATEYGLVFGVFQLTTFLASPIIGTLIGGRFSPKMIFDLGIFTTGLSTILFGFLDYFLNRIIFIVLSFILRITQGLGVAAMMSSAFTMIAILFPDNVATTFATFETCAGLGLIIGPTIGGLFYEVGGFILPFASMGAILFLTGIVAYCLLPREMINVSNGQTEIPTQSGFRFISLVKIPTVALAACSIAVCSSSTGFLEATLEPHLRDNFGLTAFYTGLVFVIDGVIYSVSTPIWGKICDKMGHPKILTFIGCLLTFLAFVIIGPAPFMPFGPILVVTCVGVGVHSLGTGASLVAGFVLAMDAAIESGQFQDGLSTYGLVSSMWVSFFSLGNFIGPSVAGVLLDTVGFRMGSLYVLATNILVVIWLTISIWPCASTSGGGDNRRKNSTDTKHRNLIIGAQKEASSGQTEKSSIAQTPPQGGRSYGAV